MACGLTASSQPFLVVVSTAAQHVCIDDEELKTLWETRNVEDIANENQKPKPTLFQKPFFLNHNYIWNHTWEYMLKVKVRNQGILDNNIPTTNMKLYGLYNIKLYEYKIYGDIPPNQL